MTMKTILMLALMLILGACSHGKGKSGCTSCDKEKKAVTANKAVEYDGHCAMGLCLKSQQVKCDPTITAAYKGKNYCFSSEKARDNFMKDIDANVMKSNKAWEEIDRRGPRKT